MKLKNRLIFLSLASILTLLISLALPITAFADEGTPPVPTEESALPPIVTPTEEAVPPEEAPIIAEVFEQLPEGTEIVVVNEEGDVEPLVTEAAAEIIIAGDPQWCMEGHTPADDPTGGTYCTAQFTHFNGTGGLIEELTNFTGVDSGPGTIYISWDYDVSTAGDTAGIVFDYGDNDLTDLTFQGGWDFVDNTIVGQTTFSFSGDAGLDFWDWGAFGFPASLTINDIVLDGGYGLYVGDIDGTTTADVTLDNVDVIDTDYGAYIGTEGDASITQSSFNDTQDGNSLTIESDGDVILNNVSANGNDLDGASVFGSTVHVEDSEFNGNGEQGLFAIDISLFTITLNNVVANGNGFGGAALVPAGNLVVTNSQFNGNGYEISDCGDEFCLLFGGNGLTVLNSSFLLGEGSEESVITLNSVTANENALNGASFMVSSNSIEVTNSQFHDNGYLEYDLDCEDDECECDCFTMLPSGFGLMVADFLTLFVDIDEEPGAPAITLNNVIASGNALGGALLATSSDINVFNSQFNNNGYSDAFECEDELCLFFSGNGLAAGDFFYIFGEIFGGEGEAGGASITLNHVTANENYGNGVFLLGNDITVQHGVFNENGGIVLDEFFEWGNGLLAAGFDGYASVSITCSGANDNAVYGFEVHADEATLNSATASGNDVDDFYIDAGSVNIFTTKCDEDGSNDAASGTPSTIIPITGGEQITCAEFSSSVTLMLPSGDFVTLACPINEYAVVEQAFEESLPGPLGEGNEFISSLSALVIRENQPVELLEDAMVVSFVVPVGMEETDLAILFWNGSEWIELEGHISADGLHFEATTNQVGTFVLVKK